MLKVGLKNKNKFNLLKKAFPGFFILIFLSSCFSEGYAPKNIKGSVIETSSTVVNKADTNFKNKPAYYYLYENNTYQLMLGREKRDTGNYVYKRTGKNKGELIFTYVKSDSEIENSFTMTLFFETSTTGKWEISYENNLEAPESGEFELKGN